MCTSLPSQDNPLHVTPDNTSRQTLQKVGFAWEHEYQLCAPDNLSNRSDCYKNKNSKVSFLMGDTITSLEAWLFITHEGGPAILRKLSL